MVRLAVAFTVVACLAGQIAPQDIPPVPGPRIGHSLVYDEARRAVILLDGYSWIRAVSPVEPPRQTQIWQWNGSRWSVVPGSGPASRTMSRAVYDSARKTIVSYGGRVGRGETPSSETWEWGANGWRKVSDAASGPNVHVEMAHDAARAATIRFGGATPDDVRRFAWPTETWTWNGAAWSRAAAEGPPGRAAAATAFDATRREVVLFGGQGAAPAQGEPQPQFNDTWLWNGSAWRRAQVDGPPARAYHAMCYDSRRGLVMLYGGNRGEQTFEDLWVWDGSRWTQLPQPGVTPGKRRLHAIAYDEARDRVVLFGGAGPRPEGGTVVYDDTWEWDGTRWSRVPIPVRR